MQNWKLKLNPLAVYTANARANECEKMRCQQLDMCGQSECYVVSVCAMHGCFLFTYTLGDVAHINLFIYFLFTTFFSLVHSIFAASFSVCACVFVSRILYAMRVHFNCPKIVWTILACAREHVFVVCILKQWCCIFRMCVWEWWCEAPLI